MISSVCSSHSCFTDVFDRTQLVILLKRRTTVQGRNCLIHKECGEELASFKLNSVLRLVQPGGSCLFLLEAIRAALGPSLCCRARSPCTSIFHSSPLHFHEFHLIIVAEAPGADVIIVCQPQTDSCFYLFICIMCFYQINLVSINVHSP